MCSACASASGRTAVTEMSSPRHSPPSRAVIWDRVQVAGIMVFLFGMPSERVSGRSFL